ncbi:histidine kinase dimerization/phosphoacceptor domain -containing protein [uncultured Methanospirillum sp.]|uniref:histidine kinase dimerization/phosphoacceptor domain -containing protein n=1 Tax=uncultured Methanospirillum sp. TaxID=262503 RepID=UPI0029C7825C|nr:histidine kinase dimerization/phosphoacceptor domain -containing protein [uncultured Methanospirillum sp.]
MIVPKKNNVSTIAEDGASESDLTQALTLITSFIQTKGKIPDLLPGTQEEQELLISILVTLKSSQHHLLEISEGKLDSNIELRGTFGGALKHLQSNLRHLTWKTQAIAKGDFSQKVDFLHDFSIAFNSMVKDLEDAKKALLQKTDEIQAVNRSLSISTEQYKSLILTSPISICIVHNGVVILANHAFSKMLHISSLKMIEPNTFIRYIHPDQRDHFSEQISLSSEPGVNWNQFEEEMVCEDGTTINTEFVATDIIFENNPSTLFFIYDITTRKKHELQILSSLQEKEILLKEVYHRVKNNLQIIWSLLSIQSRQVKDETVKEYFIECQNRIKSLALLHETLYRTDNLRDINYGEYLTHITTNLIKTYNINSEEISLEIEAFETTIPLSLAVPCSLIVNEMVTNSLKYAFNQTGKGTIKILFTYNLATKTYHLDYRDSGPGFPDEINPQQTKSLGMQLIYGLTKQLKGTIFQQNDNGVHFTIEFPLGSDQDEI